MSHRATTTAEWQPAGAGHAVVLGGRSTCGLPSSQHVEKMPARFDAHVAGRFIPELFCFAAERDGVLLVDASDVVFIDEYGLRLLADTQRALELDGGGLGIVNASVAVRARLQEKGCEHLLAADVQAVAA